MNELYSSSFGTGVTMRDRLPPRWVWNHEDEQRDRMDPVMAKHGEFALDVINYMIEQEKTVG